MFRRGGPNSVTWRNACRQSCDILRTLDLILCSRYREQPTRCGPSASGRGVGTTNMFSYANLYLLLRTIKPATCQNLKGLEPAKPRGTIAIEPSISWEAICLPAGQEISRLAWDSKCSLLCSQKPYPEPDESNAHPHTSYLRDPLQYYPAIYIYVSWFLSFTFSG
jgi:hypothetical protein